MCKHFTFNLIFLRGLGTYQTILREDNKIKNSSSDKKTIFPLKYSISSTSRTILNQTISSIMFRKMYREERKIEPGGHYLRDYFRKLFCAATPTRESVLPMQFGCTRSCDSTGSSQMYNPGRVHWRSNGKHNI